MRTLILAISAALTLILSGWVNTLYIDKECQRVVAKYEQSEPSKTSRKILKEWSHDMLRTAVETTGFAHITSQQASSQNARLRHTLTTKDTPHVSPCQHLGHVTDIINISPNASSQSNDYYLHTLCRLRI